MTLKYLLDENVTSLYQTQIQHQEPDIVVWRIGTAGTPKLGTLDPEILKWCEKHDFILITNNRKSMPGHLIEHLKSGHHIPGIFILNEKMTIGETINELILIALVAAITEYQDRICYLPLL